MNDITKSVSKLEIEKKKKITRGGIGLQNLGNTVSEYLVR
jgi:hypothetical protein